MSVELNKLISAWKKVKFLDSLKESKGVESGVKISMKAKVIIGDFEKTVVVESLISNNLKVDESIFDKLEEDFINELTKYSNLYTSSPLVCVYDTEEGTEKIISILETSNYRYRITNQPHIANLIIAGKDLPAINKISNKRKSDVLLIAKNGDFAGTENSVYFHNLNNTLSKHLPSRS